MPWVFSDKAICIIKMLICSSAPLSQQFNERVKSQSTLKDGRSWKWGYLPYPWVGMPTVRPI